MLVDGVLPDGCLILPRDYFTITLVKQRGLNMISIGRTIKKLRVVNGVSQKEMAEKLKVSCQTISKWENEKTYPDIGMLPEIAGFFHITIDALFQGNINDADEVMADVDKGYLEGNKTGWDQSVFNAWDGTILPSYGPYIPEEGELQLFGDIKGKAVLELACGNGKSLLYQAKQGAKELYGLDISKMQIADAQKNLADEHINATLFVSPMEVNPGIPFHYFDCVYSIYGIGWSLDISKVFYLVSRYLKTNGIFIFSWDNPFIPCLESQDGRYVLSQSYEEEKMMCIQKFGMQMNLRNWKISSYINALIENGLEIEKMVEASAHYDRNAEYSGKYYSEHKAGYINHSFVIKARKRC